MKFMITIRSCSLVHHFRLQQGHAIVLNKVVEGEVSTRPDAAITVMNRHALKENVGFSETKIAQFTRERAALCLDFARLAYLSKQAVDNNVLEALFFFQIHSFTILFSISHLDTDGTSSFTYSKNIKILSQVTEAFWKHCFCAEPEIRGQKIVATDLI
ncbi:hypothetical protein G6F37_010187 [Rhizopus arrhizus]|nr:hypothetical protein G6F38_010269 [Rhizopus arrhizus]KAG1153622.1 hypothetical protein G6F37_010187 [Rhizopus arrhizus]